GQGHRLAVRGPAGVLRQRVGPRVHELQQRCLADEVDGALRVLNARELHDDAPAALPLQGRFDDTQLVDAVLDDPQRGIDRLWCGRAGWGVLGFQDQVATALQVQSEVEAQLRSLDFRL